MDVNWGAERVHHDGVVLVVELERRRFTLLLPHHQLETLRTGRDMRAHWNKSGTNVTVSRPNLI